MLNLIVRMWHQVSGFNKFFRRIIIHAPSEQIFHLFSYCPKFFDRSRDLKVYGKVAVRRPIKRRTLLNVKGTFYLLTYFKWGLGSEGDTLKRVYMIAFFIW